MIYLLPIIIINHIVKSFNLNRQTANLWFDSIFTGHNVGISAPHLLPANAPHVKNCTNLIAGGGNGAINTVGMGNRLPQGIKLILDFIKIYKY